MEKKTRNIIDLILVSSILILIILLLRKNHPDVVIDYPSQIDSLEYVINSKDIAIDSLYQLIDNTNDSIIYITKWYEKDINYIMSSDNQSNMEFFTDYLSKRNSQ